MAPKARLPSDGCPPPGRLTDDVADPSLQVTGTRRARVAKALRLAREPSYWRPLATRVAASVEHSDVDFRPDIATVLDVGASRGQFAAFALQRFPTAKLICFEPLERARTQLLAWAPSDRVTVHPIALGMERGDSEIHVSAHDDSSSLLPIGAGQAAAFPGTGETARGQVRVDTLDCYLTPDLASPILLKIDVQGFELQVLAGAGASLRLADEVYVECSFVELYDGQALADAVVGKMRESRFRLAGVYGVVRGRDGTCIQADFLFRRTAIA